MVPNFNVNVLRVSIKEINIIRQDFGIFSLITTMKYSGFDRTLGKQIYLNVLPTF